MHAKANPTAHANPWLATRTRTGAEYDAPYLERARQGEDVHGEATLVDKLLREMRDERVTRHPVDRPKAANILDAGCGTGRTAIELAQRGYAVVGVDLDAVMLRQAKHKAPSLRWLEADLATVTLARQFDAIVMAGNVMIYVTPGTERAVLENMTRHLKPGGILISGFELTPYPWSQLTIERYDELLTTLGMQSLARWSTWSQAQWRVADAYAVSVHRKLSSHTENAA